MAKRRWQHVDSETLYEDSFFKLTLDNVIRPDGTKGKYSVISSSGGVFIIPVTADGKVILIEQERYPVRQDVIEIPAGTLDPNMSPLEQARIELHEECGAVAEELELLGTLLPSPARQVAPLHVVVAKGVKIEEASVENQDGNEAIHRVWAVEQTELVKMIREGVLVDTATMAAFSLYWTKYGYPKS
jgi:ADP-ribose pyrophosphatase